MSPATEIARVLAEHRQQMEQALEVVRTDASIDDRERGRRITRVIAAANARALEIMSQGRRPTVVGGSYPLTGPIDIATRRPLPGPGPHASGPCLQWR
jgi:hypothetical protein